MRRKELKKLLKEREKIELKSSLSLMGEIIESIVAFANAKGGKIVVGINNTGRIIGVQIGKGTIKILQTEFLKAQSQRFIQELELRR